ncbi:PilT/PilU family type 4a pilus ATPase [Candidatus Gracilibacteria bacterium]|nr:PilT/PilU family type 4a pilus ATPase [Candidatus Gracilibacteria bacterium]
MDNKILFEILVSECIKNNYSDLHLNTLHKPFIRNHYGEMENINQVTVDGFLNDTPVLTKDNIIEIIKLIAGDMGYLKFQDNFELDISYKYRDSDRFRVNCYADTSGYNIAMRKIPIEIPSMDDLGLGDTVKQMCQKAKGLILVTGPTGCGKSTNLAAMIDYINTNFKKHILTIEDPVEFGFISKMSLVNQRELGNSTHSFSNAIRAALREDPNVIMVGEMRDAETIKAAITLAETGHLVMSTLHTNDTVQTIDRIIDVFPVGQQEQIRMQLAMSLLGVVSQRLLPRIDKEGRIAAREIMIANDAIRNLIITGKTHQLYSVIEIGQSEGMILMDKYLMVLYNKGIIDKDTLRSFARDKDQMEGIINNQQ